MPRIWKRIKKYERWFLLGIVIIVLATFSVAGQCSKDPTGAAAYAGTDFGGSYEAASGRRESVSTVEFLKTRERYKKVHRQQLWGPTLRWADEFVSGEPAKERLGDDMATWAHVAAVGSARAAGYAVGEEELKVGVRKMIDRVTQRGGRGGAPFSPDLYERVLAAFQLNRIDFETTVGEILLKDKYFTPLVEAARFANDREEGFKVWKAEKERVDLEYGAVGAAQFAARVQQIEETRSSVARQSSALDKLVAATQTIRRIEAVVDSAKLAANGALPKDEAALLETEGGKKSLQKKMPLDAWGKPATGGNPAEPGKAFVFKLTGDTYTISSPGPDGKDATADDVDRTTASIVDSLTSLRRTADALVAWRNTTDSWPTALSDLIKVPPPAKDKKSAPPPLNALPKDAWEREFAYDASTPTLVSLGADGQKGTPDDLLAVLTADRAKVPVPAALAPFVEDGLKDAWDVAIDVQLGHANPTRFESRSAGPDKQFATADDVIDGNELDLLTFYNRVRPDFRLPEKRQFEALYAAPVLVPDETFAAAWKKYPEFRPTDQEAFDFFRIGKGSFYVTTKKVQTGDVKAGDVKAGDVKAGDVKAADSNGEAAKDVEIDAADPVDGNGAALVKALRESGSIPKEGKTWPVPSADSLGEQANPATPKDGQPDPMTDPVWKNYVEKGWRRVALRDQFFEKLVGDVLKKSKDASDARKAWEKSAKTGAAPADVTFKVALERFSELQPGEVDQNAGARFLQYFSTKPDQPLSREEWEKLPDLGDVNTSEALKRLKDDEYALIPALVRAGAIRAAFHNIKIEVSREPELLEVRDKVFIAYLEGRAMDRAARELDAVAAKLKEKDAKLADVLAAAAKERDFTYTIGTTGRFVGPIGARRALVAEAGATDDVKLEMRRRNYVRRYGYDVIKSTTSSQDTQTSTVGSVGRRVLEDSDKGDEATHSAYVVRVKWSEDPSPEEFHGKDYAKWLADTTGAGNMYANKGRVGHREGSVAKQLGKLFDDWDGIRRLFVIETNSNIEMPPSKAGS